MNDIEKAGELFQKYKTSTMIHPIANELIRYLPYCDDIAKDTKERWISWLEKQGEQNYKIIKGKNYFCVKTHNYAGVEWIKGTKYYASDNYTLVNQGCECYCPEYSKEEHNNLFEEVKCDGCVEKQAEQKSADKVEPKFKVGDWIINNDKRIAFPTQILKIEEYGYVTSRGYTSFNKVKTDYHLWTIQDAKDGDIIVNDFVGGTCIAIYKSFTNDKTNIYCHLVNNDFCPKYGTSNATWHPATKEQRNILFQKMKEAGYEWYAEKKELKKIEQICYHNDGLYYAIDILEKTFGKVEGYQSDDGKMEHQIAIETVNALYHKKPTEWSEEDEKIRQALLQCCDDWGKGQAGIMKLEDVQRIRAWVEKQKPKSESEAYELGYTEGMRVKNKEWLEKQKSAEWSEKDENKMEELVRQFTFLTQLSYEKLDKEMRNVVEMRDKSLIAWLKSLKHQLWKSIDERTIPSKEFVLNVWMLGNEWKDITKGVCCTEHGTQLEYIQKHWKEGDYYEKIKSQPHWKPCEKQLEALRVASEVGTANNSWAMSVLKDLLEELKLLKDYD